MGYPMTYPRVISRNGLLGNYADGVDEKHKHLQGDLRRLEADQRDNNHLRRYAEVAGVTDHQAWLVLTAFFTDFETQHLPWLAAPCWPERKP